MYAIYKTDTGEVISFLDGTEQMAALNTPAGAAYVVHTGALVQGYYSGGTFYRTGEQPSVYHDYDYVIKAWVDKRTTESAWMSVRSDRDERLRASDWTQLGDITAGNAAKWEPYRQALRDVTKQPDPRNIIWPVPPQ